MYICLCHGVTDKKIEQTIDDGATTMRELTKELKVGSQCGKCCCCTKKILNRKLIQIADITDQVA
ncbi:MAG: bacterioferritin-associated ferredoxin [Pseudoalteromonas tetraodonis]|jgi:bacterioferritin-associated ferredoxin|uniref:Bacterioferritin-associated ferredoxin n=1 Tax=Pseudoalteromonas tetraodonis GFC TaxID=1315271 RepID=A0AA37W6E9_9GAMM|nr:MULTISPECIES: (2Fe-2S)-binding protein [Pseudoalteromonas]OLF75182.1 bacterioferritin [Pseudoalteromonas haloplanktis]ADT70395.1 putative bacterioferritin-associated ferredoxin [Pseudoalteromonas sp. SM9913]MCK8136299.1 (2Fe-2S)-binding protein [Pseudoalteromonas sp. 2CM28B]MDN3394511.1 (2Fe-2S)-binding protein [Pseudoalteromonas sp. APC 3215]MDN3400116.1 (2Fe-2S)-binding protein [Pseudoalteromonas sp. APC 3213]